MDRILFNTISRSFGSIFRILNLNKAVWGTTFPALPAIKAPTETTEFCQGDTLRDTIVCNAITSDDPQTTGSILNSGIDP